MTIESIDFENLFREAKLDGELIKVEELARITNVALTLRPQYETVAKATLIPWSIIAAIHFRECNQKLDTHLHNGDPLSARTIHIPKGRPAIGDPPFAWSFSAIDALHDRTGRKEWDIVSALDFLERYNGLGYRTIGIYTPYVWDYTSLYTKGLFRSDGVFDPEMKESRPGCAAMFKVLHQNGIDLGFTIDEDPS